MAEDREFMIAEWTAEGRDSRLRLVGATCNSCSVCLWPPSARCKACGSDDLAELQLGPFAELWSVTVDRIGLFVGRPTLVGQVRFPEGTFVQGYVVGDVGEPPPIGSPMELVPFELARGDESFVTYAFKATEV